MKGILQQYERYTSTIQKVYFNNMKDILQQYERYTSTI